VIVINEQRPRQESSAASSPEPIGFRRLASLLLPPLVLAALIFFLSAQPDDGQDRATWDVVLRKLAHVTEYLLLALATWRALRGLRPEWKPVAQIGVAALFTLAYAVSDEFHQTFVDGRNGTPVDVAIDAVGISIACLLALRTYAGRRRRTVGPSRPSAT
jgi:VanZ family protein